MIRGAALLLLAAVGIVTVATTPSQVRESSRAGAVGTASIAGRVLLAGEARQPARRARVTLTDLSGVATGLTTTTNDEGAFVFEGVPAGRFEVQAFKHGYLRSGYGASRPERSGTPVAVRDGDVIRDLVITMARGGVITGRVRDQRGRPVPDVSVRVLRIGYHPVTGARTLTASGTGNAVVSDDRGEYRAFGLPPGGYLIVTQPPPSQSGGRGADDIRQVTVAEVQRALQAARGGGIGVAPTVSAPSPAPPPARLVYAPVFHPGVTDIGTAATVALGVSEERSNVDIALSLVPTATITGTVSDPDGALAPMLVLRLLPAGPYVDMLTGAGFVMPSAQLRPDGSFVVGGVPAGTYTLIAAAGRGVGRGRGVAVDAPTKWAATEVVVAGRDLEVSLVLQPGVPIRGRVVFEGAPPPPADLQALTFQLVSLGPAGSFSSIGGGRVDADGRFSFLGIVPDNYRFTANWTSPAAADRWSIKSSIANGREAYEAPMQVAPAQPVDWTVTFTETPARLTGTLQDVGGRAATDYYMLVFSVDRAHWTPGTPRLRMVRPATDGTFSVKGLPPGEYHLAALTDLGPGEWNDPLLLESLVPASAKVTLREGETTRQDFRVGGAPGQRQ